jgi:hypothetical protein
MSEIGELIERLEKLTGPDREIDADIAATVGAFKEKHGLPGGGWVSKGEHYAVVPAPRYTESIDAAMTMLPEGFRWGLKTSRHRRGYFAETWTADGKVICGIGDAPTPAIALCIAILRAIEGTKAMSNNKSAAGEIAATPHRYLAPLPWAVDADSVHRHWTNSLSIMDAEDGEVAILTRGYEGDEEGDDCPSWTNANLIAEAALILHETGLTPRQLAERVKELEARLAMGAAYRS